MRKLLGIAVALMMSGVLLAPAFADTPTEPSERQQRRIHKDEVKKGRTGAIKQKKSKPKKQDNAKKGQQPAQNASQGNAR